MSKMRPRNSTFLTTAFKRFSQKDVRVWGKNNYCWWKWMQTVLEVENLKLFSDSCIALATLLNVLPRTQSKVVHEQEAIRTLQDSLNYVANLDAEQGWRQDSTLQRKSLPFWLYTRCVIVLLVKNLFKTLNGIYSQPYKTTGATTVLNLSSTTFMSKISELYQTWVIKRLLCA